MSTAAASWEKDVYVPYGERPLTSEAAETEQEREKKDWELFLEATTVHGFAYLVKSSKFFTRRVLWTLYIVACMTFCIYYGSVQLHFFLQFKSNMLLEVLYTNELPFPTVTFCNQNPFKLTPSVEAGWYVTAKALTGNGSVIHYRACNADEFACEEDQACVKVVHKCDGFPDCLRGSDEVDCNNCTLIRLEDGGQNASLAFNRQYRLQMMPSYKGYRIYISVMEPFIYLYNDELVWYLSDKDQMGDVYATMEGDEDLASLLGEHTWHVITGNDDIIDVQVNVACDVNYKELAEIAEEKIDGSLDTKTLYTKTGHKLEDLLTRCIWKRKYYCSEIGNITTTLTDLGLCYSIQIDKSVIDNAGWSYGMSLTFNIEHYEYVKRSEDGIGIKMFMHEPGEFPLMYGQGVRISPGLVSYVALQITELTKLKRPWGNCTDDDLKYYDKYGQTKCRLECETDHLQKTCGCRLFYMPHENNQPPVCDVDAYFNCAVNQLQQLRLTDGACPTCRDQCRRTVYTALTSFAQRGTDSGRVQSETEYNLQKQVFIARETDYRNVREKYKATTKVFDEMIDKMSQLLKFLEMLQWQIKLDNDDVVRYVLLVYTDCYWSRDILLDAQRVLEQQLLKPLADFKQTMYRYLVKVFPSLESWTSELITIIESARVRYQLGSEALNFTFTACKADCRNTLQGMEYRGSLSLTVSGLSCQRWDTQTPHPHPYTQLYDSRFPEGNIVDASDFCRNPDGKDTGPWCYTTETGVVWETCQVPICSDCIELGEVYRGNRELTLSGRTCQRWNSQSPHPHRYTDPSSFPDASLSEAANFCRNPDKRETGPWCYTTDPDVEWETCALPMCKDCVMKNLGTDYVGTKSTTKSGIPCQRWDMQYPHKHSFNDVTRFPDASLADASNFCRNPDQKVTGPWCYTTDPGVKWQSCNIPLCSGCRSDNKDRGTSYIGRHSITIFGRTCQRWDSQTPHQHDYTDVSMFPDVTLKDASNYCRNPDPTAHSAPWCYTTDPDVEWEPCDIPLCKDCMETSIGMEYNGNKAVTISNRPCQRWDSQYPHQHSFTDPEAFPDSSLFEANNYCRNPDGNEHGPWCYTNDPEVTWETCGIDICPACILDELGRTYSGTAQMTRSGRVCQKWSSQTPHSHPVYSDTDFPDANLEEASNYCRNPDGREGVGPWCFTTDPDTVSESCGIPVCPRECIYSTTGVEYTGTKQTTISGLICQQWSKQHPHSHQFTDPEDFADKSVVNASNFCRNPDGRSGTGPWCFTTDPDKEWESCGIPRCKECVMEGVSYTGKRRVTKTGITCQRWDADTPHNHQFTDPELFPDKTLKDAENFCRNPDGRVEGPWCYTTDPDVELESCEIPVCKGPDGILTDTGIEYRGLRSTTQSGLLCQRWDLQQPHQHPYTDSSSFPDESLADAGSYCRNPNSDTETGPWCYTQDPSTIWESCSIVKLQAFTECIIGARGLDYVGRQVTTVSGRTCQAWSEQFPHMHPFTDHQFPDGSKRAASNYCRNPDNKDGGPWCFTQDPVAEWEYCGIYRCSECRRTYLGKEYRGRKSISASGFTCQRWDSQYPHKHNFTNPERFPDESLSDAANYCRNPDGRSGHGPWCYTIGGSNEWEFCGIPFCYEQSSRITFAGQEYRGVHAITASGRPCQFWNSQSPHLHPYTDASLFPEATLLAVKNFCRNPDGRSTGPWCYTMDPDVVSETCSIPLYSDCLFTQKGMEYLGKKSITSSGLPCQRWDSQYPHQHNFTDSNFNPEHKLSDAENFCRNPDGRESGPWCFTKDPGTVWESCRISRCQDCKQTNLGTNYQGTRSYTLSGRICQKWSEQLPHRHSFVGDQFPDDSLQDASNYCRNPDNHPDGPWCFTIDSDVEREPCGIKLCMKTGCVHNPVANTYRGHHFWTRTGQLCQRWDRQTPHRHNYTESRLFPDSNLDEASNFCRNPDNDPEGPWCFTMNPAIRRQSCGIPTCSDCVDEPAGTNYLGRRAITASGRVCQRWDSQVPHSHNMTDKSLFPDTTLSKAENYCRNPDSSPSGPWCYTLDPDTERESCDVSPCTDCISSYYGYDYVGQASITISGFPCQRWDSLSPHVHKITDQSGFPEKSLQLAENYCRNPGRRYGSGTWCYTEDPNVEWEPCGVPLCRDCIMTRSGTDYIGKRNTSIDGTACRMWNDTTSSLEAKYFGVTSLTELANYCRNPSYNTTQGTGPWCYREGQKPEVMTCGIPLCKDCKESADGWEYKGKRHVTISGQRCQRWDELYGDVHQYGDDQYPDGTIVEAANYCRNPDRRASGPWCFTSRTDWDTCNIPYCKGKDCTWRQNANDYRGSYSHTVSGRTCMRWGGHGGQKIHAFNDSSFPDKSIDEASNYCRNPDNSMTWPWCYTTDPQVEWEFCPIINCRDCRMPDKTYSGKRSFTKSGIPCQRWDQQLPHAHRYTDEHFPGSETVVDASNYCRTPDGSDVPWCFTLDPELRREDCAITDCSDCYMTKHATDYRGTINITTSGIECQRWDKPNNQSLNESIYFDNTTRKANNFCRNPEQEVTQREMPWCYTTDPDIPWEYCPVVMCEDMADDCIILGLDTWRYDGNRNITKYGFTCDYWSNHTPPVTSESSFNGNIIKGQLEVLSKDPIPEHGIIADGQCYRRSWSISKDQPCNDRAISDSDRLCTNQLVVHSQYMANIETLCKLSPDEGATESCCVNETQVCRLRNVTAWCLDHMDTACKTIECDHSSCCPVESSVCDFRVDCCNASRSFDADSCIDQNQFCSTQNTTTRCLSDANAPCETIVCNGIGCCQLESVNCAMDACFCNSTRSDCCSAIDFSSCADRSRFCDQQDIKEWCQSHLDTSCDSVICNASVCCPLLPGNCSVPADYSCCNVSSSDCCTDNICTRTLTTCYRTINMSGYWIEDWGKSIYDRYGEKQVDDFVSCSVKIVSDTGKMMEPIVDARRSIQVRNYCRNPDESASGPWCYTTDSDVPRQSCDIPFCSAQVFPECRQTYDGYDYLGTISNTLGGVTCQRWDSQMTKISEFNDSSSFPEGDVSDARNYCRNPDRRFGTGPFCVIEENRTETCGIPLCPVFSFPETPTAEKIPGSALAGKATSDTNKEEDSNDNNSPDPTVTPKSYLPSRCDYHLYRSVSRHNQSIWKTAHAFISSLYKLQSMELKTDRLPQYVINQTMIVLVEANVANRCQWCMETVRNRAFLEELDERVNDWRGAALRNVSVEMLAKTEETMERFLESRWLRDIGQPVNSEDVELVREHFRGAALVVKDALDKTQQTITLVREAGYLNRELLNNVWQLECKVQLQQLLSEYDRYRRAFQNEVDEFRIYLKQRHDVMREGLRRYLNKETTLEEISRQINFQDMQLKIQGAKIKVDKSLDKGQLLVNTIHSHINKIFYSILSFISRDYLRSRSEYWKQLRIQDPSVKLPKMKADQGTAIFEDDYGMVPDGAGQKAWDAKMESLKSIRRNMERYVTELTDEALDAGREYVEGYLKGIQIDDEFYRNNFLQVEIFYQEMASRKITEEAVYPTGDLFSEVGGLMGLLLGASFLSLVEIVDFIVFTIWKNCVKPRQQ